MELHHHAGGAVATLSAPVSGQTLLYGVVPLAPAAQTLHGRHLPALADVDGCQAAVDGPGPAPLRLGDGDYAGPTAALTARHLRPGEQRHLSDVLGQAELAGLWTDIGGLQSIQSWQAGELPVVWTVPFIVKVTISP